MEKSVRAILASFSNQIGLSLMSVQYFVLGQQREQLETGVITNIGGRFTSVVIHYVISRDRVAIIILYSLCLRSSPYLSFSMTDTPLNKHVCYEGCTETIKYHLSFCLECIRGLLIAYKKC